MYRLPALWRWSLGGGGRQQPAARSPPAPHGRAVGPGRLPPRLQVTGPSARSQALDPRDLGANTVLSPESAVSPCTDGEVVDYAACPSSAPGSAEDPAALPYTIPAPHHPSPTRSLPQELIAAPLPRGGAPRAAAASLHCRAGRRGWACRRLRQRGIASGF